MKYEINDETLVLVPMKENKCEVIEKTGNIPLDENTFKVIEHSCDYFGVKYKSRVSQLLINLLKLNIDPLL